MDHKRKIILTGYRATGKSSVGRLLAERLGLKFIDMDKVLEARFGPVSKIVEEHGWDFFRTQERQLLSELVHEEEAVIATGGGAITHTDQWRQLMETGLTVWLTADIDTICKRLAGDELSQSQRPSLTGRDIREEVSEVLNSRQPLYQAGSHISVDSVAPIGEIVETIEKSWARHGQQSL